MSKKISEQQQAVLDYLMDNYYDDAERMIHIKMVQAIALQGTNGHSLSDLIDKIALFNGIKKSYKPKVEELVKEFIEGVNFIMFLDETSKGWSG
jgi:hypothetical protein